MVYFIQADSGPVKVGYTTRINSRLGALQIGSWDELSVIGLLQAGQVHHERRLHWKFRDAHIRGEWFAPVATLIETSTLRTPTEVFQLLYGYESEFDEYEIRYTELHPNKTRKWCPACNETVQLDAPIAKVGCCVVHLSCAEEPPADEFMPNGAPLEPRPRKPKPVPARKRRRHTKKTASMRKAFDRQLAEGSLTISRPDDNVGT